MRDAAFCCVVALENCQVRRARLFASRFLERVIALSFIQNDQRICLIYYSQYFDVHSSLICTAEAVIGLSEEPLEELMVFSREYIKKKKSKRKGESRSRKWSSALLLGENGLVGNTEKQGRKAVA